MKVRALGVVASVQDKFEQAKQVCPMALRKVIFAYKSGRMPNLTMEEVTALLGCEVLLSDGQTSDQLLYVFNVEMEELFWRTTQSTLQLIPLEDMAVSWPDRSDWPWSQRVPSSRKSGPISTRRPLADTSLVVGMFSTPKEGGFEEDNGGDENLVDPPQLSSLLYGSK